MLHLTHRSPSSSVLWAGFGPPNSPPYTCRRVKSLRSQMKWMDFRRFFVSYLPVFVSSFRKADRANFDRRYQTRTSDRATQMSANTAKAETEKEIAPVIDPFRYMRGFLTSRFSAIRTDQKIVKLQRFMFNHVQQIGRIVIPSKIEWDLPNGPLRKLLELLDSQV